MKRKLTARMAGAVVAGAAIAGSVAGITTSMASAAATPAATVAAGGAWSTAIAVRGVASINDLTCTSPGMCVAVGGSDIATERDGIWHAAQTVPGVQVLGGTSAWRHSLTANAVSCSSAGNCAVAGVIGGNKSGGNEYAWVATENRGTWGKARLITGSKNGEITAVSCAADGDCTAVGSIFPRLGSEQTVALVVRENGGTWGKAKAIALPAGPDDYPYFALGSVSCTANGYCTASGYINNGANGGYQSTRAMLITEADGAWGAPSPVPGLPVGAGATGTVIVNNNATTVSCQAPGDCTVAGAYGVEVDFKATASGAFIATQVNGVWRPAILLGTGSGYNGVAGSCAKVGDCALLLQTADSRSILTAQQVNGTVGATAVALPGFAALNNHVGGNFAAAPVISCDSTGYCAAGGQYDGAGAVGYQPFVAVKTAAGWQPAQKVHGLPKFIAGTSGARITHISCTAPGFCTAAGFYATAGGFQAFVLNEATASAATLSLSKASVAEGHETAEHLTVTVKSPLGTPGGSVTVKAAGATLCKIALKGGKGGCTLKASQLKPGTYKVSAAYAGGVKYIPSSSAAEILQVTK